MSMILHAACLARGKKPPRIFLTVSCAGRKFKLWKGILSLFSTLVLKKTSASLGLCTLFFILVKLFCPKLPRVFCDRHAVVVFRYVSVSTDPAYVCVWIYSIYMDSEFCDLRKLRERGSTLPATCLVPFGHEPGAEIACHSRFALLCLKKEQFVAPLSIPETLTCDVYRLNPRVRLLGAASRALASWTFGGTCFLKAKTKEKKVFSSDWVHLWGLHC